MTAPTDSVAGLGAPDVYFTAGYGQADARTAEGARWTSIVQFDGRWQLPVLLRPVADGLLDARSPYGYSGVYADPMLTADQLRAAWDEARARLRDWQVVSLVLRHSPLVPQAATPVDTVPVVTGHPTRLVEVDDATSAWHAMEGRARTTVRKAERLGVDVTLRPARREDLVDGSPFRTLYERTMVERRAADSYVFPSAYYDALLDGLGSDLLVGHAADAQGDVLAAALFLRHGPTLHYHLSGSSRDGFRSGASTLLLWRAISSAPRLGVTRLHLGGGVRRDDSLYRFKRSIGGRDLEYRVSGLVIDKETYAHLVDRAAGGRTRHGAAALHGATYFPAYRRSDD